VLHDVAPLVLLAALDQRRRPEGLLNGGRQLS
jgi:hypothetical protein